MQQIEDIRQTDVSNRQQAAGGRQKVSGTRWQAEVLRQQKAGNR